MSEVQFRNACGIMGRVSADADDIVWVNDSPVTLLITEVCFVSEDATLSWPTSYRVRPGESLVVVR